MPFVNPLAREQSAHPTGTPQTLVKQTPVHPMLQAVQQLALQLPHQPLPEVYSPLVAFQANQVRSIQQSHGVDPLLHEASVMRSHTHSREIKLAEWRHAVMTGRPIGFQEMVFNVQMGGLTLHDLFAKDLPLGVSQLAHWVIARFNRPREGATHFTLFEVLERLHALGMPLNRPLQLSAPAQRTFAEQYMSAFEGHTPMNLAVQQGEGPLAYMIAALTADDYAKTELTRWLIQHLNENNPTVRQIIKVTQRPDWGQLDDVGNNLMHLMVKQRDLAWVNRACHAFRLIGEVEQALLKQNFEGYTPLDLAAIQNDATFLNHMISKLNLSEPSHQLAVWCAWLCARCHSKRAAMSVMQGHLPDLDHEPAQQAELTAEAFKRAIQHRSLGAVMEALKSPVTSNLMMPAQDESASCGAMAYALSQHWPELPSALIVAGLLQVMDTDSPRQT